MSARRVSVVIPVKDDLRVFDSVASVVGCRGEVSALQIVVVDNGSEVGFADRLRVGLPAAAVLFTLPRPGVYAARNVGIDNADGDVVFFTDADCIVRPGWLAAGLQSLKRGADIAQGYSGSTTNGCAERLVQARYEKHLRRTEEGEATECDTRNLAVRRPVFDRVRFNERYRRVGDTEFGLLAEVAGFRVAYAPRMRVDHAHDPDLALFVAKQLCHGWGAQRLDRTHPEIRWHGGHLRTVAWVSQHVSRGGRLRFLAGVCRWLALFGAQLLQRCVCSVPEFVGFWWLTALDKLAALAGHLSYAPGAPEPSPSEVLGRSLPRD